MISYKQPQKVAGQPLCLLKCVIFRGNIHQSGCDAWAGETNKLKVLSVPVDTSSKSISGVMGANREEHYMTALRNNHKPVTCLNLCYVSTQVLGLNAC